MADLLQAGLNSLAEGHPVFTAENLYGDLLAYMDLLELYNPAMGLVSVQNRKELIVRHILDSLAPLPLITELLPTESPNMADIGSGAGLPGIPLALALRETPVTLIERMGRRVSFLHTASTALKLKNIEIEEIEFEKARSGPFKLITFRAFRPLSPTILKSLFRLLSPEGSLFAYKGKREKIEEELNGIAGLIGDYKIHPISVPFLDEERHIVQIKKAE